MTFDTRDLARLLVLVDRTASREIDCDEYLSRVAAVVEGWGAGRDLPPGAREVLQHVGVCPECQEEFDALRALLRDGV